MGFEPRIIPAIYVKTFNKGQKNDYNDAVAIAEAALRPNLKTVSEKTQEQLDLQALHRVRSRLASRRTAMLYIATGSTWPQDLKPVLMPAVCEFLQLCTRVWGARSKCFSLMAANRNSRIFPNQFAFSIRRKASRTCNNQNHQDGRNHPPPFYHSPT